MLVSKLIENNTNNKNPNAFCGSIWESKLKNKKIAISNIGGYLTFEDLNKGKNYNATSSIFGLAMMQVKIMGICILSQGLVAFGFFIFLILLERIGPPNWGFFG